MKLFNLVTSSPISSAFINLAPNSFGSSITSILYLEKIKIYFIKSK